MATEKKAVQSAQAMLTSESASKGKKAEAAVIPSSIKFLFGGLAGLVGLLPLNTYHSTKQLSSEWVLHYLSSLCKPLLLTGGKRLSLGEFRDLVKNRMQVGSTSI